MGLDRYAILVKATDYQTLSSMEIIPIYFSWSDLFPEASLEDAEKKGKEVSRLAVEDLLRSAQKNPHNIYVGRGKARKKEEKIPLCVKFRNNAGKDEDDDDEDDDNTYEAIESERDSANLSKEEKEEAKKDIEIDKKEGEQGLRFGGVVGALSGSVIVEKNGKRFDFDIEIQIRSRMDADCNAYFINTLLCYGDLSVHEADVYFNMDSMFDFILIDVLAIRVKKAIAKGFYRTYQRFERNNDRLKGNIDIARHIRVNSGQDNGAIAYTFRENTVNNSFNQLLLLAYRCVKEKYPELVERKIDSDIVLADYFSKLKYQVELGRNNVQRIILENAMPISHPYYTEFEDVRNVCLQILRDEGVSLFDANTGEINGFLFYLPDLWEDYLEKIMQEKLDRKYKIVSQPPNGFMQNMRGNAYSCLSRPDFIFKTEKEDNYMFMLDAKFKPTWQLALGGTKLAEYCAEDINKCLRDMVVANTNGTGVIFPYSYDMGDQSIREATRELLQNDHIYKRKISKYNDNYFYVFPVGIPKINSKSDYAIWKQEFDENINIFLDEIYTVIKEIDVDCDKR